MIILLTHLILYLVAINSETIIVLEKRKPLQRELEEV